MHKTLWADIKKIPYRELPVETCLLLSLLNKIEGNEKQKGIESLSSLFSSLLFLLPFLIALKSKNHKILRKYQISPFAVLVVIFMLDLKGLSLLYE